MPPVEGMDGPGGGFASTPNASGSFSTFTESSRTMFLLSGIAGLTGIFSSAPGFTVRVPPCTWYASGVSGRVHCVRAF